MAWNLVNDENFAFAEGIRKGTGEAGADVFTFLNNGYSITDYNDTTEPGVYLLYSGESPSHAPASGVYPFPAISMGVSLLFVVIDKNFPNNVYQILVSTEKAKIATRQKISGNFVSWKILGE